VSFCEDRLLPSPGFLPCGQKTHPASRSITKAHFSTDCFKKKKTSLKDFKALFEILLLKNFIPTFFICK